MIATIDEEVAARIGEFTALDILHPRTIDANRHVMFCLACHRTGMATDTLTLIDHKCILHQEDLSPSACSYIADTLRC